jgi:hypothetical protein
MRSLAANESGHPIPECHIKQSANPISPSRLWFWLSIYPSVELRQLFGLKAYRHAIALTARFGLFCDPQLDEQIVAGNSPDGVR